MNAILGPDLNKKKICSKVPFAVNCNSIFLVDLLNLGTSRDIICDDMGSWGRMTWVAVLILHVNLVLKKRIIILSRDIIGLFTYFCC